MFEGEGEVLIDDSVLLPQRVYCFDERRDTSNDCVVRVELAGTLFYEDKVKRSSARAIGLQLDAGCIYFFDRLAPSS